MVIWFVLIIKRKYMKIRKIIYSAKLCAALMGTTMMFSLTTPGLAKETTALQPPFLQEIQDQLTTVSGLKDQNITIVVIPDKKRIMDIRPDAIRLSYGLLQHMQDVNQLISTLAHATAHIALDYVTTPPLPEDAGGDDKGTSAADYIASSVRPRYPDKSNPPVADAGFQNDEPKIIERPRYENEDYRFEVNKADVAAAEQELRSDEAAGKILAHAGYCPSDYSRMLQYFYEHPQKLLGNDHYALDSDQWQRVDAAEHLHSTKQACSPAQINKTQKHAEAFNQWKARILGALHVQK
tara:strand:- start:176 stop:1060 length:885 start_codon:yes stop_codon:yes gene_type:complete